MAGKARRTPTYSDEVRNLKSINTELYSLFRNKDTPHSIVRPTFGTSASIADATGKLLTAGDTMIGPIAFATKLISIASDAIDVSKGSSGYSTRVIVAPESGTTDNLVTINGAAFDGQLLMIQGVQADSIVVKNSGNIETIDGADFTILDDDIVIFVFDVTDNKWQQVTTGKNGNFANRTLSNLTSPTSINQSLIPNADGTLDLGDGTHRWNDLYVQRVRVKNATVVANKPIITGDATDGMIINVATGQQLDFRVNDVSKWTLNASQLSGANLTLSNLLTLNDNAGDPPATNGIFARNGVDVKVYSGGAVRNLSDIGVAASGANVALSNLSGVAINTSLLPNADGTLDLGDGTHRWNDLYVQRVRFKNTTVVANKPIITADATDGMVLNVATGQQFDFRVNDVSKWTLNASQLSGANITISNILTLNDNAGDPISAGQFARNSADVKVFSGGAVRNLSDVGTTGGANVNLSNLSTTSINQDLLPNADGTLDLGSGSLYWDDIFVEQVRLKATGGTVVTNIPMITSSATGDMILNVNTGDIFDFQVLGVSKWTITTTTLSGANIVLSNTLSINDSSTITTTAGQFSRSGAVIYIGGAFAPGNTGTQDLGGSGRVWNDFWVEQVRFHQGTIVANKPIITADATDGMILNVATGQQLDFRVNNVSKWTMNTSTFSGANIILSNTFTLNDSVVDPSANGQFTRNATHVKVFSGGAVRNLSDIGAGGVTYPLTPDKNARGNVTGTVTIDLSLANAHVQTMTLIGNITFVFSNPPASTKNIQFQLDITQDGTGGRTITWPASVTVIPVLPTTAGSRIVLLCQTSNGGTTYDVFSTGTAASVLNAANQTLSNLTNPTSLNTDLHLNDNSIIFDAAGALGAGHEITRLAGGMAFGVPTGKFFDFYFNGLLEYELSATDFDFKSNNLKGVGTTITGSTTTNVLQQDATGWTYKVALAKKHVFTVNSVSELEVSGNLIKITNGGNLEWSAEGTIGTATDINRTSLGLAYNVLTTKEHVFLINNTVMAKVGSDVFTVADGNALAFDSDGTLVSTNHEMRRTAGGILINVPTGKQFAIDIAGVQQLLVGDTQIVTQNNDLIVGSGKVVCDKIENNNDASTYIDFVGANVIEHNVITGGTHRWLINGINHMFLDVSTLQLDGDIQLTDGKNIIVGTTTGTKIGTSTLQKIGFFNSTPIVKPTVTGSRGGNAALASLLTALANLGLVVDSTTA